MAVSSRPRTRTILMPECCCCDECCRYYVPCCIEESFINVVAGPIDRLTGEFPASSPAVAEGSAYCLKKNRVHVRQNCADNELMVGPNHAANDVFHELNGSGPTSVTTVQGQTPRLNSRRVNFRLPIPPLILHCGCPDGRPIMGLELQWYRRNADKYGGAFRDQFMEVRNPLAFVNLIQYDSFVPNLQMKTCNLVFREFEQVAGTGTGTPFTAGPVGDSLIWEGGPGELSPCLIAWFDRPSPICVQKCWDELCTGPNAINWDLAFGSAPLNPGHPASGTDRNVCATKAACLGESNETDESPPIKGSISGCGDEACDPCTCWEDRTLNAGNSPTCEQTGSCLDFDCSCRDCDDLNTTDGAASGMASPINWQNGCLEFLPHVGVAITEVPTISDPIVAYWLDGECNRIAHMQLTSTQLIGGLIRWRLNLRLCGHTFLPVPNQTIQDVIDLTFEWISPFGFPFVYNLANDCKPIKFCWQVNFQPDPTAPAGFGFFSGSATLDYDGTTTANQSFFGHNFPFRPLASLAGAEGFIGNQTGFQGNYCLKGS